MKPERHAWIDVSAGVAGDMLLAALIDAGAEIGAVQAAVDAVIPGAVRLVPTTVTRAGLRSLKVDVEVLVDDPPHRTWRAIRRLIAGAALPDRVRQNALGVFARLAGAEAQVHGVPADDVHFHEVGALDSIADAVGVCAALDQLGIANVTASGVAVGSGRVKAAHGHLPVPVPAVSELAKGWRVHAGGVGELATPTGMALVTTLAAECADLPSMVVQAVGSGAGTRDTPGQPNITRVIVGLPDPDSDSDSDTTDAAVLLEANIDDLDPRLWPGVLTRLLDAGAADAWLIPILMKKGRPAHTLSVLCQPHQVRRVRRVIFAESTTLGIREHPVRKHALPRAFVDVDIDGAAVAIKLAHRDGVIIQATPEFDDVAALAARRSLPQRLVLDQANAAAAGAGLVEGAPLPTTARTA